MPRRGPAGAREVGAASEPEQELEGRVASVEHAAPHAPVHLPAGSDLQLARDPIAHIGAHPFDRRFPADRRPATQRALDSAEAQVLEAGRDLPAGPRSRYPALEVARSVGQTGTRPDTPAFTSGSLEHRGAQLFAADQPSAPARRDRSAPTTALRVLARSPSGSRAGGRESIDRATARRADPETPIVRPLRRVHGQSPGPAVEAVVAIDARATGTDTAPRVRRARPASRRATCQWASAPVSQLEGRDDQECLARRRASPSRWGSSAPSRGRACESRSSVVAGRASGRSARRYW